MFIVDSNQASIDEKECENIVWYLKQFESVQVSSLEFGDISFQGRDNEGKLSTSIGIELKKVPQDLMASLRDGRVMTQLPGMLDMYDISYIVLINEDIEINTQTGKIKEWHKSKRIDSKYNYTYLNNLLLKFEAAGGHLRHVPDIEHAAAFILSAHSYWHKLEHKKETYYRKRHKYSSWKKMQDNPLAEVYERIGRGKMRLGIKKALALASAYPTFEELVDASLYDLVNLPGIGNKSAKMILEFTKGEM